jgi:hypothetical protein
MQFRMKVPKLATETQIEYFQVLNFLIDTGNVFNT